MKVVDRDSKQNYNRNLRNLFTDIINGYSVFSNDDYGICYVKHLTQFDVSNINIYHQSITEDLIKRGVPTMDERISECISEGSWSQENEDKIAELKYEIKNIEKTKSRLSVQKHREALSNQIQDKTKQLYEIQDERYQIVGHSVEHHAAKKINEYSLFVALYDDPMLSIKKFTSEEFDNIANINILKLINSYNGIIEKFTNKTLKQISLFSDFLQFFSLCDNNPYIFYGKAVVSLSFYQAELFNLACYYKNILSNSKVKPPEDMYDDPEALVDWIESTTNMERAMKEKESTNPSGAKTKEGGGRSILGASKDEMIRSADPEEQIIDLHQEVKKSGKTRLNYTDMLKMHGYNLK